MWTLWLLELNSATFSPCADCSVPYVPPSVAVLSHVFLRSILTIIYIDSLKALNRVSLGWCSIDWGGSDIESHFPFVLLTSPPLLFIPLAPPSSPLFLPTFCPRCSSLSSPDLSIPVSYFSINITSFLPGGVLTPSVSEATKARGVHGANYRSSVSSPCKGKVGQVSLNRGKEQAGLKSNGSSE